MIFDEVCGLLKDLGFKRVSVSGPNKSVYVNDDYTLHVTVEYTKSDDLTEEEISKIQERMRQLGYLD